MRKYPKDESIAANIPLTIHVTMEQREYVMRKTAQFQDDYSDFMVDDLFRALIDWERLMDRELILMEKDGVIKPVTIEPKGRQHVAETTTEEKYFPSQKKPTISGTWLNKLFSITDCKDEEDLP